MRFFLKSACGEQATEMFFTFCPYNRHIYVGAVNPPFFYFPGCPREKLLWKNPKGVRVEKDMLAIREVGGSPY